MAIYSNKIGGLSGEITDPSEGDKGYNSRGQRVYYVNGKWSVTKPGQVEITGNGQVYTPDGVYDMDESGNKVGSVMSIAEANAKRDAARAEENLAKVREMGGDGYYDGEYYHITDAAGNKYRNTSIWGDTWRAIRAAAGEAPTTSNPWYEGGDGPGGKPGPLTVTPEYPEGGPMPGPGEQWYDDILGKNPTFGGQSPIRGREGGDPGGGGGGMFEYNPPEGVPLNPIRQENSEFFRPYGKPVSRMSDTLTFGGLPRSTGPWGEMGGYYGGFPENYKDMPEGYRPPNTGGSAGDPTSPPGVIGGQVPFTPLPVNPYPARPDLDDWYAENGEPGGTTAPAGSTGTGATGGGSSGGGVKNPYQQLHVDPVTGLPMDAMQIAQQMAQAGQLRTG